MNRHLAVGIALACLVAGATSASASDLPARANPPAAAAPAELPFSWTGFYAGINAGYAFDRWLPYITGGAAYGDIQAVQPTGTASSTNVGWTAGGGLEYGFNRNWSAKVEYLHVDLGTATLMGAASRTNTLDVPVTDDLVRAGINYHW